MIETNGDFLGELFDSVPSFDSFASIEILNYFPGSQRKCITVGKSFSSDKSHPAGLFFAPHARR